MTWKLVILQVMTWYTAVIVSLPQSPTNLHITTDTFQNALQQQTFQTVLFSIEERLSNLDNIYSMQLSETLKSKLDQYHRKLELLDSKIIRLESLMMLNLDKISENISNKNYKDDVAKTNIYRKLDSVYDGLSHRMNYMDRKYDIAFDKLQSKLDSTLLRLEKMEENMMQRNTDMEGELTETLFAIDDFKSASTAAQIKLLNMTNNILNNTDKVIKELAHSLGDKLETLQHGTLISLNTSMDSNSFLKAMKLELKNDFNDYANKVADMNTDIWKTNDATKTSLRVIESVANSTQTEVQNGIRALMVQIGAHSKKDIFNNEENSLETIEENINVSLEKILSNQNLFFDSCHRLQMDESQIESEISVMLEKLIDMLEKKMTTVMKDIKSLDRTVKNHDSRTNRNMNQANTNIVSLFEKTTRISENFKNELQEIKTHLNSLFRFVQDELPRNQQVTNTNNNVEETLNHLSIGISNLIQVINNSSKISAIKWDKLGNNISTSYEINKEVLNKIKNVSEVIYSETKNCNQEIKSFLRDTQKIWIALNTTASDAKGEGSNTQKPEVKKCLQNQKPLIDIRGDFLNCEESKSNSETDLQFTVNNEETSRSVNVSGSGLKMNNQHRTAYDPEKAGHDEDIRKAVIEIFGPKPTTTVPPFSVKHQPTIKANNRNKKIDKNNRRLIDVRIDLNDTVSDNSNKDILEDSSEVTIENFSVTNSVGISSGTFNDSVIPNNLTEGQIDT